MPALLLPDHLDQTPPQPGNAPRACPPAPEGGSRWQWALAIGGPIAAIALLALCVHLLDRSRTLSPKNANRRDGAAFALYVVAEWQKREVPLLTERCRELSDRLAPHYELVIRDGVPSALPGLNTVPPLRYDTSRNRVYQGGRPILLADLFNRAPIYRQAWLELFA